MSENEILADFPDLRREDIRACLAFARRPRAPPRFAPSSMRLIFNQNLSSRLRGRLENLQPYFFEDDQSKEVGLAAADDLLVMAYSKD